MSKILHIEDNEKIHSLVSRVLTDDQTEVIWASSLEVADQLRAKDSFDLIILDLGLPDGNGADYCQKVKSENPSQGIFILSGDINIATKVMTFVIGAEDYITKPFDNSELKARVVAKLKAIS
jgi:DNA-binding response OmpR family regulator